MNGMCKSFPVADDQICRRHIKFCKKCAFFSKIFTCYDQSSWKNASQRVNNPEFGLVILEIPFDVSCKYNIVCHRNLVWAYSFGSIKEHVLTLTILQPILEQFLESIFSCFRFNIAWYDCITKMLLGPINCTNMIFQGLPLL